MPPASSSLHIALIPWPALGHLRPFTELAIWVAEQGHRISILATPRNLARLPKIPSSVAAAITLVPLDFPSVPGLPSDIQATTDLTAESQRALLRKAYDLLAPQAATFLAAGGVDWVVADYAAHWAPAVANQHGIPCAFLHLTCAAVLGYNGPAEGLMGGAGARMSIEALARVPDWVPFKTTVTFHEWELLKMFSGGGGPPDPTDISDVYRFGKIIQDCQVVAIRSSDVLEPEWFKLLEELHKKPVIPVGMLPPRPGNVAADDERGKDVISFLDGQPEGAVLYASFGTEATLAAGEIHDIAAGLELSGLPFVLVLRVPPDGSDARAALPEDFEEKVKGRGVVAVGWVPQVKILQHPAVSGFLTHGGWSSVVEGFALGMKMMVLPLVFDQGCNARLLEDKGLSVEVPRDKEGRFTPEGVAKTVRTVMAEKKEEFGKNVEAIRKVFGDEELNRKCVSDFLEFLAANRGMVGAGAGDVDGKKIAT